MMLSFLRFSIKIFFSSSFVKRSIRNIHEIIKKRNKNVLTKNAVNRKDLLASGSNIFLLTLTFEYCGNS